MDNFYLLDLFSKLASIGSFTIALLMYLSKRK